MVVTPSSVSVGVCATCPMVGTVIIRPFLLQSDVKDVSSVTVSLSIC